MNAEKTAHEKQVRQYDRCIGLPDAVSRSVYEQSSSCPLTLKAELGSMKK